MQLLNLDIATVQPNPNQPRKAFDRAGIVELADSISANGLLQPITVRPMMQFACGHLVSLEAQFWTSIAPQPSESFATQPDSSMAKEASPSPLQVAAIKPQSRKVKSITASNSSVGSSLNGPLAQSIASESSTVARPIISGFSASQPSVNCDSFSHRSCPICTSSAKPPSALLPSCQQIDDLHGRPAKIASCSNNGETSASKTCAESSNDQPQASGTALESLTFRTSAAKVGESPKLIYSIIAGERRFRACQLAGLDALPCLVMDGVDDERSFILATLENVARRDMKPIEEAHAFAAIAAMGKTPEEIGLLVGKAAFAVAWRLELLNLAPEFQTVELPMNVARLMSRMSIEGQRQVMRRFMGGDFKTVQECERFCNVVIAREAQVDMFGEAELDGFGDDGLRRERAARTRVTIMRSFEKVRAIAQAFGPIDDSSDQDVADALEGDVDLLLAELRQVEAHARRARIKLENAKALQVDA